MRLAGLLFILLAKSVTITSLDARRERVLVSTSQLIHISYNQLMNFPTV